MATLARPLSRGWVGDPRGQAQMPKLVREDGPCRGAWSPLGSPTQDWTRGPMRWHTGPCSDLETVANTVLKLNSQGTEKCFFKSWFCMDGLDSPNTPRQFSGG